MAVPSATGDSSVFGFAGASDLRREGVSMPELFGGSVGAGDGVVASIDGTGVGVSAGSITGAGDRCAVIMTAKNLRKDEATNSRESGWPDTDPRAHGISYP